MAFVRDETFRATIIAANSFAESFKYDFESRDSDCLFDLMMNSVYGDRTNVLFP